MVAADVYRPEEWHDFFVMVGGAAAVLTGLVFVALSLDMDVILRDFTHRARSIGTLTNLGGIFVISGLALMGDQGHVTIGITWLLVSIGTGFVYAYPWFTAPSDVRSVLLPRFMIGTALYLGEIVGSALIIGGVSAGLYVAATSMTLLTAYSVTGAWLLVVGTRNDR